MPSKELTSIIERIDAAKADCLSDKAGGLKALQDAARELLAEGEKPSDFIQRVMWAEVSLR